MRATWRRQICTNCPIVGDSPQIRPDTTQMLEIFRFFSENEMYLQKLFNRRASSKIVVGTTQ